MPLAQKEQTVLAEISKQGLAFFNFKVSVVEVVEWSYMGQMHSKLIYFVSRCI